MDLSLSMRGSKRPCVPAPEADAQKPCTGSSAAYPDMDGSLWSRLPVDLVERVLAWLPAASLLRLRTVCRKWREIIATKCFLEVCSQVNRFLRHLHLLGAEGGSLALAELMYIPGRIPPALLCQDLRL